MSLSCIANVKRDTHSVRPPVPPHVVYASYVGDRSGSMENQSKASATGVYEWVKEMCSGVINNNQEGYISVTFFDDVEEVRMDNIPMRDVKIGMYHAREWSEPRGCTKLFDTAITAINKLRRRIKEHKERCPNLNIKGVFQLFSDGMDNRSRSKSYHLQAAIESARTEGITCIYLGIGQDAIEIGRNYGFEPQSSLSVDIGEDTSDMAFRGVSLNALRSATTGSTEAMPQCLRQCSAPSQFNHTVTPPPSPPSTCPTGYMNSAASAAVQAAQIPLPNFSLRQSAVPPPSLRQPARHPRVSILRANAKAWTPTQRY